MPRATRPQPPPPRGAVPTPPATPRGPWSINGDGSYQYTFYRDVKQATAIVASLTDSVDGLSKKADMGDVSYDASLTHRLGIQIGGAAPGTGSNNPTANSAGAPASVNMVNTANAVYDFVPSGAAVTSTRNVVDIASCSACHDGQVLAHGSRKDPNYCVTCHTDQVKYSFNAGDSPTMAGTNPATVNGFTFAPPSATASTAVKRANYAIVSGRAVGNFPNMMHKLHMGEELVKQGYNYNNDGGPMQFNTVGLPQDPRNCTKCHIGADGTASALTAKVTANGGDWKSVPSALACGACHDGINFKTGTGSTLADKLADVAAAKPIGTTQTGHLGGVAADDTMCSTCHNASILPVDVNHQTNFATPNNLTSKAGVVNFTFDIKSVALNASKQPEITFQIKKDGVAVTSLAVPTLVTNAQNGQQVVSPTYEPIPGFAGGPGFYIAYAVPQDGISAPADYNARQNVGLANLLISSGSPKQGTLTGPDANGYWKATLTGDLLGQPKGACAAPVAPAVATCVITAVNKSPIVIPASAKIVTGAVFGSFTQKGLAGYPYTAADVSVNPTKSASGGLARPGIFKKLVATGSTARRAIVDSARCNTCHEQIGTSPAFHGGARNDASGCAICHSGILTANGWSADASTFIHAIHGAGARSVPYTWAAVSATDNFSMIGYTGQLKNCDNCHVSNTVNFGASGAALQPSLLWSTTATGSFANPPTGSAVYRNSPYIVPGTNYGNNFSYTPEGATVAEYTKSDGTKVPAHVAGAGGETVPADPATLVNSPISSACFACHDSTSAKNHMKTQGGAVYEARSTALSKGEACLVCHGAGAVVDTAMVHK